MADVSIRELRNHGGDVIDRVAAGEHLTVTRDGKAVAQLHPIGRPRTPAAVLLSRWARIPRIDPDRLRKDLDATVRPGL